MAFSWPSYPEAQKGYLPPRKTTTPKSHSEEDRYHQGRFQTQSGAEDIIIDLFSILKLPKFPFSASL